MTSSVRKFDPQTVKLPPGFTSLDETLLILGPLQFSMTKGTEALRVPRRSTSNSQVPGNTPVGTLTANCCRPLDRSFSTYEAERASVRSFMGPFAKAILRAEPSAGYQYHHALGSGLRRDIE